MVVVVHLPDGGDETDPEAITGEPLRKRLVLAIKYVEKGIRAVVHSRAQFRESRKLPPPILSLTDIFAPAIAQGRHLRGFSETAALSQTRLSGFDFPRSRTVIPEADLPKFSVEPNPDLALIAQMVADKPASRRLPLGPPCTFQPGSFRSPEPGASQWRRGVRSV